MINLLYVSHNGDLGGAERCLLSLLKHLDPTQFTPLVILPREGDLSAQLQKLSVEWVILDIPWWFRHPGLLSKKTVFGTSSDLDLMNLEVSDLAKMAESSLRERIGAIVRIITARDIHLVHTNTLTILEGGLAARIAGAKHLWHIHEFSHGHLSLMLSLPSLARNWLLDNFADHVLVPSQALKRAYAPYLASHSLSQIYNGVETILESEEVPESLGNEIRLIYRDQLGLNPGQKIICLVGNAIPEKGWIDLVETAREVTRTRDDVTFVAVGHVSPHSSYFKNISARVKELGLTDKIIFTGYRKDAQRIMLASDIVFVPSLMESFSLVAAEAMALSLPVVGTTCGGLEEVVIHNETGILVPKEDHQAMGRALGTLLDNYHERQRLGQRGREVYLEKFTPQMYANNIMDLYQRLAKTESRKIRPGNHLGQSDLELFASLYAFVLSINAQFEEARFRLAEARFQAHSQLTEMHSQLAAIIGSKSYRLMEPLRRLRRILVAHPPKKS